MYVDRGERPIGHSCVVATVTRPAHRGTRHSRRRIQCHRTAWQRQSRGFQGCKANGYFNGFCPDGVRIDFMILILHCHENLVYLLFKKCVRIFSLSFDKLYTYAVSIEVPVDFERSFHRQFINKLLNTFAINRVFQTIHIALIDCSHSHKCEIVKYEYY